MIYQEQLAPGDFGFASPELVRSTRQASTLLGVCVVLSVLCFGLYFFIHPEYIVHINEFLSITFYFNACSLILIGTSIVAINNLYKRKVLYVVDLTIFIACFFAIYSLFDSYLPVMLDGLISKELKLTEAMFFSRNSMPIFTSMSICILSISILLAIFPMKKRKEYYQYGCVLSIFIANISMTLILFDFDKKLETYNSEHSAVFLFFNFCIWMLSVAAVLLKPRVGIMRILTNDNLSGKIARYLISFSLFFPIVIGGMILIVSAIQNVSTITKFSIFTLIILIALIVVVNFVLKLLEKEEIGTLEKEILFSNALLKIEKMINNTKEAIVVFDIDKKINFGNDTFFKLFDFKKEEVLNSGLDIIIPDNLHNRYLKFFNEYLMHPTPIDLGKDFNLHFRKKDQSEIPVSIQIKPLDEKQQNLFMLTIRDESDHYKKTVNIINEIGKFKLSEFELLMANQIDCPEAMASFMLKCICKYTNWELGGLYHYMDDKLEFKLVETHAFNIDEQKVIKAQENFDLVLKLDSSIAFELMDNRQIYWISSDSNNEVLCNAVFKNRMFRTCVLLPIKVEDRVIAFYQFYLRGLYKENFELDKLFEKLCYQLGRTFLVSMEKERINQSLKAREETLARVSHDLQNPLNTILGSSEALKYMFSKDNQPSEDVIKFTELIDKSVNVMQSFIGDLLDFSKMQAGSFNIDSNEVDITPILKEAIELVQFSMNKKKLRVEIKNNLINEFKILVDKRLVLRALLNLLNNAIKFSPREGEIIINLNEKDSFLNITVSDQGPGISADHQSKIFTSYWRSGVSESGTGLGLSISRAIAEAHKGKLTLDSTIGKGSNFHFCLPMPTNS